MSIYRIFPKSDASIYSEFIIENSGIDEVLEIGGYKDTQGKGRAIRTLVKYDTDQIKDVIDNKIKGLTYSSSLKMFLSEASEIPQTYNVEVYPLSEGWVNGTGKHLDSPTTTNGVSWFFRDSNKSDDWLKYIIPWIVETGAWVDTHYYLDSNQIIWHDDNTTATSSIRPGTTGSFDGLNNLGGAVWFTGSFGVSQSIELYKYNDLNLNVTNTVAAHYGSTLTNHGFIVKVDSIREFTTSSNSRLSYFSRDTNTIYPPSLEFGWDDSSFITASIPTSSNPIQPLYTDNAVISIKNNRDTYKSEGKVRFRISARPKNPKRVFTTGSIYLQNYYLPSSSYWGLKDETTQEMVVNFDEHFTKISCDPTGSYFDFYLDGIEPERYYRVLFKTTLNESTSVYDDKSIFKVSRNG